MGAPSGRPPEIRPSEIHCPRSPGKTTERDWGPLHMSPVDRAGRVTKIKKGQRSWGRVPARNSRENTIFITFAPTITLATLKAVSLQLNGMLNRFN